MVREKRSFSNQSGDNHAPFHSRSKHNISHTAVERSMISSRNDSVGMSYISTIFSSFSKGIWANLIPNETGHETYCDMRTISPHSVHLLARLMVHEGFMSIKPLKGEYNYIISLIQWENIINGFDHNHGLHFASYIPRGMRIQYFICNDKPYYLTSAIQMKFILPTINVTNSLTQIQVELEEKIENYLNKLFLI